MFLSGHYEYSRSIFLQSNDPYIQDKYDLDQNLIYYFNSSDPARIQYSRAFKRDRWLEWIALIIGRKYVHINNNSYDTFLRTNNPHLILFVDKSDESNKALQQFTSNYETYFETLEGAICQESEKGCQEFTRRLGSTKFNELEKPFIIILTTSKITSDPLIYFYPKSMPIIKKNMNQFVKDFKNKEIQFSKFSEVVPEVSNQTEVQKVVHDSMTEWFINGFNVDLVMLFYDSRECLMSCGLKKANKLMCNDNPKFPGELSGKCDQLLEKYTNMVKKLRNHSDDHGEHVRYAHYDLGKNSYQVYQIKDKIPFIRIYKLGKYNNFVDHVLPDNLNNFENDIIHFLLDTTTHDLNLHEIEEDM